MRDQELQILPYCSIIVPDSPIGLPMNNTHTKTERELIKLIHFFKKYTKETKEAVPEEFNQLMETCDKFEDQIYIHEAYRKNMTQNRENLKTLVKDNAACPKCNSNTHLKFVGVDNTEKFKSNRYRCRKCNIQFTWNRPNNPWEMIPFLESLIEQLDNHPEVSTPEEKEQSLAAIRENLTKIKNVIYLADSEYEEFQRKDLEMSRLVHEFANFLQIEKIKLNVWKSDAL